MEQNPVSSDPKSVCERIFKAVSVSPVRTIRRISYRPIDATPTAAAPNTSAPTLDPSVKAPRAQSKTVAPRQPVSLVGCQRTETPEKKKAAEVVPIDFERSISIQFSDAGFLPRSDKKENSAMPQVSIQSHIQAAKDALKIEPKAPQIPALKENKTKPKVQMIKSTKTVVGEGRAEIAITAGVEVAPPHASVLDRPKPKAAIFQQEKAVVGSGQGQVDKFASKTDSTQPRFPGQERTNSKKEMVSPTKMVLEQSHGQGAKVIPKVGHGTVYVPMHDQEKAKPKVDKEPPAKIVKDQQLLDKTGEEGKKSELDNSNDKFSDYINRAKLKIRATSDAGAGKNTPRVDSMNEKITNFIDRAKFKIRTSSSIGGGKNVSFK